MPKVTKKKNMKNTIYILLIALAFSSCGNRNKSVPSDTSASGGVSRNVIDLNTSRAISGGRDTINLGRMKEGELIEYKLGVRNTDSTAMVILDISTTCGCTMLDYDTAPIVPGDTASVVLSYDSKGQAGSQIKLIQLRTSFSHRPYNILLLADVHP